MPCYVLMSRHELPPLGELVYGTAYLGASRYGVVLLAIEMEFKLRKRTLFYLPLSMSLGFAVFENWDAPFMRAYKL